MGIKKGEILVSLWCDFEPYQKEWGDWGRFDFWKSAFDLGYPQKSLEMAERITEVKKKYGAKITWGVFSCVPFFEWIDFLNDFLKRTAINNDSVTVHPHWLKWVNDKWERERAPSAEDVYKSLKQVLILSKFKNYSSMVRSGWNTKNMADGKLLMDEYKLKYGFSGVGDIAKVYGGPDYVFDGNFLKFFYDTDSMENAFGNCVSKWKTYFVRVIKKARNEGATFSWWFHIHEISPAILAELIDWTLGIAQKNGVIVKFINAGDMHKCLQ